MFNVSRDRDTICALATPAGVAALAVIRLSGKSSESVIRLIAPELPIKLESHRAYYTFLRDPVDQGVMDEVVITYFAERRSYTFEPSFEISCHGSPAIVEQILRALVFSGARSAERGEFTYRAYMNGRIDLVQAESVLDLIESQTARSAKLAVRSVKGELSKVFSTIEDDVSWLMAQLEANIDFSSEDIVFAAQEELQKRLQNAMGKVESLILSYKSGRLIKEGVNIVIVGAPNVGKSSLFNRLSGEDRSIVSKKAGTTRDIVDFETQIDGRRVRFVDSAGIRETDEEIERLGIERSKKALESADVILNVFDASSMGSKLELSGGVTPSAKILSVANKADLLDGNTESEVNADVVVSAFTGAGIESLRQKIAEMFEMPMFESGVAVCSTRQYEALMMISRALFRSKELLDMDASPELVASELTVALAELLKLRGVQANDEVMDRVFREFCLGK